MIAHRKIILADDPEANFGDFMEFRLTYEGLLLGSQSKNKRSTHKHEIRREFHSQLTRLWQTVDHLRNAKYPYQEVDAPKRHDYLATQFSRNGYRFVPLVTEDLSLLCSIEILFLRPDKPGTLISSGDIDNRIKTLLDALRMPTNKDELGGYNVPEFTEDPFYCLLEDDKLISKLSVETDTLLQPTSPSSTTDPNDTRLIITVRLRPYELSWENINFG